MLVKLTADYYWKKLLENSDFSISRRLTEKAEKMAKKMAKENVFGGRWHKYTKAVQNFFFAILW